MRGYAVRSSIHAALLLSVVGVFAWVSGHPFVFPSLGPSAFVLATMTGTHATDARRVVGGHLVGVVVGLLAHHVIAPDLIITTLYPPLSVEALRLAASGVVAVSFTTSGMILSDTVHPPACATTLIVALGLLSTVLNGFIIMASVLTMVGVHEFVVSERSDSQMQRPSPPNP